ncbi:hypothetical protein F5Y19DRAFT_148438 [Xylariaceae sp. FL1651]|nr:hypothetical protein F5Y19DRAFT_148438 [Xylariaceae sp. FL1651]
MGRPPAYIFVVRHGNRLDAADRQWHLTSPTPYDPPLTYGGWMQSRAVGARIASILQDEAVDSPSSSSQKRRRFRVVIHSSPFLRCVQTSIAISAGLASNDVPSAAPSEPSSLQAKSLRSTQASSFSNPAPTKTRPTVPISAGPYQLPSESNQHIEKSVLRLDAFLGEWLSPEYFEHITPPPKSALMLATAKAELLRRESYHDYPHFHSRVHSSTSNQLWSGSPSRGSAPVTPTTHGSQGAPGLETLSSLVDSLPEREGGHSSGASDQWEAREARQDKYQRSGYVFPVPSYALSSSEPIPKGYVAHARDACVDIDYQWDSSRDSLAWGDGGLLPEEWASMHQRFRRGLGRLVSWYSLTDNPGKMVTKTAHTSQVSEEDCAVDDGEELETEDVVVLVSHGAGCNALIGAITQQPVLADVAMSSLTMAKRRAGFDYLNSNFTREKSASLDAALPKSRESMPEMYELKLFANTDHLHSAPTPPAPSRLSSLAGPNPRSRFNTGYTSALKDINFGASYGSSPGGSRSNSANASLGSMRRSPGGSPLVMRPSVYNANTGGITVGSGVSNFSATRPGSRGLWSPKQDDEEHGSEGESPMLLDFSYEKATKHKEEDYVPHADTEQPARPMFNAKAVSPTQNQSQIFGNVHDEEHDKFDEGAIPHLWAGTGNGGLWGAPRPPGEAERLRDFSASKRRWTVNER